MPRCCCCCLLASTTPWQLENQTHLYFLNSNSSHALKGKYVCPSLWMGFCTVVHCIELWRPYCIRSLTPACLWILVLSRPWVMTPALGSPLVYENCEMTLCGWPLGFIDFYFFAQIPAETTQACSSAILKTWSCDSTAGGKHNTEDWKRTLLLPSPIRGLLTQASLLLSSHLGSTDVQNILRTLPRWQLKSTFYLAKHMEMETLDSVGRKCHCATSTTPFQRHGIKRKSVPAESLLWLFVSYASHVTVILAPIKSNMIFY